MLGSAFFSTFTLAGRFVKFLKVLFDFFVPPVCLVCGKDTEEELVCQECINLLSPIEKRFCILCGNPFTKREVCKYCKDYKLSLSRIRSLYKFEHPLPLLIHEFKYKNKRKLGEIFGKKMAVLVRSDPYLKNAELIIPVPLHPSKKRERGYNQSEIIALQISQDMGIRMLNILKRVKNTRTQTELSVQERRRNVEGAFVLLQEFKETIKGKKVLLVDDVITTGATLDACSEVLLKNGAQEVYGVTLGGAYIERK